MSCKKKKRHMYIFTNIQQTKIHLKKKGKKKKVMTKLLKLKCTSTFLKSPDRSVDPNCLTFTAVSDVPV